MHCSFMPAVARVAYKWLSMWALLVRPSDRSAIIRVKNGEILKQKQKKAE